ncbi:hypothetical protein [Novacetimonas pomaceti]|uniref:hypothetical protein n=1 Tax=Novacetimonas pomaceti TaxID=2021998 RepID=UPI0010582B86|nr:hypothetical protein [Novacetimonas pomaceti]
MPKFSLFNFDNRTRRPLEFEDFIGLVKGGRISSAAARRKGSKGEDFIEFGISEMFNLRISTYNKSLQVMLIPLSAQEFPPVQMKIIEDGENVTAELLERRLHSVRQIYAIALLIENGKENELSSFLEKNKSGDIERELIPENDKLLVKEAIPGSLWISFIAKSKATYKALLYVCAVPYARGRDALLGRLEAGTELARLEVEAKRQDQILKNAHSMVDLAQKISKIKDPEAKSLILSRLESDMKSLVATDGKHNNTHLLDNEKTIPILTNKRDPNNSVKILPNNIDNGNV